MKDSKMIGILYKIKGPEMINVKVIDEMGLVPGIMQISWYPGSYNVFVEGSYYSSRMVEKLSGFGTVIEKRLAYLDTGSGTPLVKQVPNLEETQTDGEKGEA